MVSMIFGGIFIAFILRARPVSYVSANSQNLSGLGLGDLHPDVGLPLSGDSFHTSFRDCVVPGASAVTDLRLLGVILQIRFGRRRRCAGQTIGILIIPAEFCVARRKSTTQRFLPDPEAHASGVGDRAAGISGWRLQQHRRIRRNNSGKAKRCRSVADSMD
jgi:hypothetical protein